jgi:hypothetical protein
MWMLQGQTNSRRLLWETIAAAVDPEFKRKQAAKKGNQNKPAPTYKELARMGAFKTL